MNNLRSQGIRNLTQKVRAFALKVRENMTNFPKSWERRELLFMEFIFNQFEDSQFSGDIRAHPIMGLTIEVNRSMEKS